MLLTLRFDSLDGPFKLPLTKKNATRPVLDAFALTLWCGPDPEVCLRDLDRLGDVVEGPPALWVLTARSVILHSTGRHELALDQLPPLPEGVTSSDLRSYLQVQALFRSGQTDAAERVVALLPELGPERRLNVRIELGAFTGDRGHLDSALGELGTEEREPSALNQFAWSYLYVDGAADAVALAEEAVRADAKNAALMHTLATAYASVGRVREARQTLEAVRRLRTTTDVSADDWYVLGRIAEHLGESEAARSAYERVVPGLDDGPLSTLRLAQRRLATLPAPAAPHSR